MGVYNNPYQTSQSSTTSLDTIVVAKGDLQTEEKACLISRLVQALNCFKEAQPSLPRNQLCWTSGFKEYDTTFFPKFMHAHLRKNKIEDVISEYIDSFLDTELVLEVRTGSVFIPMRVHTNVFVPKGDHLVRQSSLAPAEANQASQLVQRYSVPVGIRVLSLADMRKTCNNHIEDMISNPQYAEQATAGHMSQLPRQILEIVCEYSAAKKDVPFLHNLLKLHAIHYFMSNLTTFSEESVGKIYSTLFSTSTLPTSYVSSRLLNKQIKFVMHILHHETTQLVLEDLERSLCSRTRSSWGPSFCAILIPCLCIEELQNSVDIMVVCEMQEKGEKALYTRYQSYKACKELDDYPFQNFKKLFHEIYKSHSDGKGTWRGVKAFNPLKAAAMGKRRMEIDSTTEAMARAIYGVVNNHWNEIVELSDRPTTVDSIDPNDININNTGRLIAKFLRSFLPDL